MAQLIELVFEHADTSAASGLLRSLIALSDGVRDVVVDGQCISADGCAEHLVAATKHSATVRLVAIDIPGVGRVRNVAVRLLKIGADCIDVEFSLDVDDPPQRARLAAGLHGLASDLAKLYSVPRYFAGLEPAVDKETRLFTGECMGPLHFPEK